MVAFTVQIQNGWQVGPGWQMGAVSGSTPTPGVDGSFGYAEMSPPVIAGNQLEDSTATVNNPTGFTINSPLFSASGPSTGTGFLVLSTTTSNNNFLNTLPAPAFYNITLGAGSTATNGTAYISGITPLIMYLSEGLTYPFTVNYPITITNATPLPSLTINAGDFGSVSAVGGSWDGTYYTVPPGSNVYNYYLELLGANPSAQSTIDSFFAAAGLSTTNYPGYVFQALWADGRIGLVRAGFDDNAGSGRMYLSPIDSTDPAWRTSGADPATVPALAGAWKFPVTLTAWTPTIELTNNWC